MLKNKFLVSLVCVFSVLFTSGCNEVSRVVKSEINGISCDSMSVFRKYREKLAVGYDEEQSNLSVLKTFNELREYYLNNYGINFFDPNIEVSDDERERLERLVKFDVHWNWYTVRTTKSDLLNSPEIYCSATTTLEVPNFVFKSKNLSSDFDNYKAQVSEMVERMKVNGFEIIDGSNEVIAGSKISFPTQYKIIVADNASEFEVEILESDETMELIEDIMRLAHIIEIVHTYDAIMDSKIQ